MQCHAGTARVNGDLVWQFLKWVKSMRQRGCAMMVFGAPYEADAQLVQLEKQGLVNVIVTEDIDTVLLGGRMVQFGFNKRGQGSQRYSTSDTDLHHFSTLWTEKYCNVGSLVRVY